MDLVEGIQETISKLNALLEDPEKNKEDILWLITGLAPKYHDASASIPTLEQELINALNRSAKIFISPELSKMLDSLLLKKYSFVFAAHHFFDVQDVLDDLEKGQVLKNGIPAGSFNRLKKKVMLPVVFVAAEAITIHQGQGKENNFQHPPSTPTSITVEAANIRQEQRHEDNCRPQSTPSSIADFSNGSVSENKADDQQRQRELMHYSRRQLPFIQSNMMASSIDPLLHFHLARPVRLAQVLIGYCQPIGKNENGMEMYKLPLIRSKMQSGKLVDRWTFGEPSKIRPLCKTILLMGATGSGKTTLINSMVNFILNVEWGDPFRFHLTNEELSSSNQAHSQTKNVTVYELHYQEGFAIPYSIILVDTPGYGDTAGLRRDKEITMAIEQLFTDSTGILELDALCFVTQAGLARLTGTQRYIFESVVQVFGNDIKENISFLITFSDCQTPPVLSAIKEAKITHQLNDCNQPLHHQFNNSGFLAANQSGDEDNDEMNKKFWDIGMTNFNSFFTTLSFFYTKSLSLSKQVLYERQRLHATVQGLTSILQHQIVKIEELKKTKQIIKNHSDHININQDFNYEVVVTQGQRIVTSNGQKSTNCSICNISCHFPCSESSINLNIKLGTLFDFKGGGIPFNDHGIGNYIGDVDLTAGPLGFRYKKSCLAMGRNDSCTVCPKKCKWELHNYEEFLWKFEDMNETKAYSELKARYEASCGDKLNAEEVMVALETELKELKKQLKEDLETITNCLVRLNEIALRPDSSTLSDYIGMMIATEQREKKPGFGERIDLLQELISM